MPLSLKKRSCVWFSSFLISPFSRIDHYVSFWVPLTTTAMEPIILYLGCTIWKFIIKNIFSSIHVSVFTNCLFAYLDSEFFLKFLSGHERFSSFFLWPLRSVELIICNRLGVSLPSTAVSHGTIYVIWFEIS